MLGGSGESRTTTGESNEIYYLIIQPHKKQASSQATHKLTSMEKALGTELSRMLADETIIESFMLVVDDKKL